MDFEKFIDLQKKMRENNAELADYLDDFASWKADVDLKNRKLEAKPNESRDLPAVRNSLFQKRKKKARQEQPKPKTKERIKSYDYRAWDKFDVDKALEEQEQEDRKSEDHVSSASETDDELENQRRIGLADEARNLGNVRFKEGKLDESIEQYSLAIRLCPENPLAYCNRALAYLKTERFASAEVDCTAALKLDSRSVKALFRRALARKALDRKQEAIEDLKSLLNFDPNNKQAQTELDLLEPKPKAPASQPSSSNSEVGSRKRWKMRRIPIVEVGGGTCEPKKSMPSVSVPDNTERMTESIRTMARSYTGAQTSPAQTAIQPVIKKYSPVSMGQGDSVKSDELIKSSPAQTIQPAKLNKMNHHQTTVPQTTTINIPSNWFQLERELRELCPTSFDPNSDLSARAIEFFCAIPYESYSSVIRENLDTRFLSQMLQALCRSDQLKAVEIAHRLSCLADLPRFDVAWLMTNEREQNFVRDLKFRIKRDAADVDRKLVDKIEQSYS